MCSQLDDPTTYDAPEPVRPRTYRLSGDRPEPRREPASVALAVLGTMIDEADEAFMQTGDALVRGSILREVRDRVRSAEARR